MAVNMSMLMFWVVTSCGRVGTYQRFGGTYCSIFKAEVHMALLPTRPISALITVFTRVLHWSLLVPYKSRPHSHILFI
jgi:hypothetical protein